MVDDPARHARVKAIFLAIREAPEQRRALLDELCDDEAIRREVETLLDLDETRDRTGEPAVGAVADLLAGLRDTATPPDVAGFRLLDKLGEGGMGEVWAAEQLEPVRRRVALKVLKGALADKSILARFESERQALALMTHPTIARVYQAGATEDGRPYLAMELVHGLSITEYCDRHRLSLRRRLALFAKVCAGVQHAHQKGVIHRDIKPSNVLVAVDGEAAEPKLIDFGIAKAVGPRLTEHTLHTAIGQWIGTPEYMSPEQAETSRLDVDTRTDVYSLGVLLYELLTGSRPFDVAGSPRAPLDELRRRIRDDEPTRPSTKVGELGRQAATAARDRQVSLGTWAQTLAGDLDWITLKAMEKDRTRRYASPSELAADVGRHLRDEPVEARPPTASYRMRKFVRRHRLAVAAAGLVTAALLAGLIATSLALGKARAEARRANQVAAFLDEILDDFDPYGGRPATSTEAVLDRAAARVDTELAGQPLIQARLMRRIASAFRNRDLLDKASPVAERALTIAREELGETHPSVIDSLLGVGWLAFEAGTYTRAREVLDEAVTIERRRVGFVDRRVAVLIAEQAFMTWADGDFTTASRQFDEALAVLGPADRNTADLDLAQALFFHGVFLNNSGEPRRAHDALRRALDMRRTLLGPDHLRVGWTERTLARSHALLGDYEPAQALGRRALDHLTSSFGPEHTDLSYALDVLAEIDSALGHAEEATAGFERSLALREAILDPDHPEIGLTLEKFGHHHLEIGDPVAAGPLLERALAIDRRRRAAGHPQLARKLHSLSRQRFELGRVEAARELQDAAIEQLTASLGPDHPLLADHWVHLAALHADAGDRSAARHLLDRALEVRQRQLGSEHPLVAQVLCRRGRLGALEGDVDRARRDVDRGLALYRRAFDDGHPAVERCRLDRAATFDDPAH